MDSELVELCPICIENEALYFTECGHKYCVCCLSRIKKCAMCRKSLLRSTLCIEIKRKKNNGFVRVTTYVNENERFSEREGSYFNYVQTTNYSNSGINTYSFAIQNLTAIINQMELHLGVE
jgi:hypothetical protein